MPAPVDHVAADCVPFPASTTAFRSSMIVAVSVLLTEVVVIVGLVLSVG